MAPHPWMGVHRPGRTLQSPRPRTSCCLLGSTGICLGWAGALGGGASLPESSGPGVALGDDFLLLHWL